MTETSNISLLQEMHHRINNNMQMISSMLSLEAAFSENKTTKEVIKSYENRIQSIQVLHLELFRSADFINTDLKSYISALLLNQFSTIRKDKNTELKLDLDKQMLNADVLIPLGLMVNEIISNSKTHARNLENKLKIHITGQKSEYYYQLTIADNGPGFDFSILSDRKSVGLQLIKHLCKQINGKLEFHSEKGSSYQILFPI